jgi:predicted Holliday junction resolvase-like endonuclease
VAGVILGACLTVIYFRERISTILERWRAEVEEKIRREAVERSRVVLKGKIGEQMAPLLPDFRYEPADARFIGSPVDYIVFEGYSEGEPRRIVFVDVKTGKGGLSPIERKIREVVEKKKVDWETVSLEDHPSSSSSSS